MRHSFNSSVLTVANLCTKKTIHMLLMHLFDTLNTCSGHHPFIWLVPGIINVNLQPSVD